MIAILMRVSYHSGRETKAFVAETSVHPVVALLPIGRELLTGRVQDSNSRWLAERLFGLGIRVIRTCTVDDVPAAIALELRRSCRDGAGVLVSTGGLGPTPDDVTLEGVALATRRPLRLDPAALSAIRDRYDALHRDGRVASPGLNPDRERMAWLPAGSLRIPNSVGTAPGVDLAWGKRRVFCLPGVPAEMTAMAEATVLPAVAEGTRSCLRRHTEDFRGIDESGIASVIRFLSTRFPGVLIKPDPKGFGPIRELRVHFEAQGEDPETVEALLAEVVAEFRKAG
jgi:molybdenum cofactor synthesis domain-containing protein